MVVNQETRTDLKEKLTGAIGKGAAAVLMEHLPPVGWADVATKSDLDHLGETLRLGFRAEMADLRTDLRTEMANLRTEMHVLFGDFRDEIRADRAASQRQLIFVLVVALISLVTSVAF